MIYLTDTAGIFEEGSQGVLSVPSPPPPHPLYEFRLKSYAFEDDVMRKKTKLICNSDADFVRTKKTSATLCCTHFVIFIRFALSVINHSKLDAATVLGVFFLLTIFISHINVQTRLGDDCSAASSYLFIMAIING